MKSLVTCDKRDGDVAFIGHNLADSAATSMAQRMSLDRFFVVFEVSQSERHPLVIPGACAHCRAQFIEMFAGRFGMRGVTPR